MSVTILNLNLHHVELLVKIFSVKYVVVSLLENIQLKELICSWIKFLGPSLFVKKSYKCNTGGLGGLHES